MASSYSQIFVNRRRQCYSPNRGFYLTFGRMDVCRRPCLCIEKMFAHLFLPQQERSCVIVRFQTSTKTNPTFCCKITQQLVGITIISYTYIEYIWIYLNLYDTWWLIKILLPIKTPACPPELDTGSVVFSILWRFESTLVFSDPFHWN